MGAAAAWQPPVCSPGPPRPRPAGPSGRPARARGPGTTASPPRRCSAPSAGRPAKSRCPHREAQRGQWPPHRTEPREELRAGRQPTREALLLLRVDHLHNERVEGLRAGGRARGRELPAEVPALAARAEEYGPSIAREPRVEGHSGGHLHNLYVGEVQPSEGQDLERQLQLRDPLGLLEMVDGDLQARRAPLLEAQEGVRLHTQPR